MQYIVGSSVRIAPLLRPRFLDVSQDWNRGECKTHAQAAQV